MIGRRKFLTWLGLAPLAMPPKFAQTAATATLSEFDTYFNVAAGDIYSWNGDAWKVVFTAAGPVSDHQGGRAKG